MRRIRSSVLLIAVAEAAVASPSGLSRTAPELAFTATVPLLSGGLDGCPTPLADSCTGGLAAASAILRQAGSPDDLLPDGADRSGLVLPGTVAGRPSIPAHVFFMPGVDRESVFSKLHPLGWGVNLGLFQRLDVTHFVAAVTFATPAPRVVFQATPDAAKPRPMALENFAFHPSDPLSTAVVAFAVHPATGIAVFMARIDYAPLAETVSRAQLSVSRVTRLAQPRMSVVVLYSDLTPFVAEWNRQAGAAGTWPDVIVHLGAAAAAVHRAIINASGTVVSAGSSGAQKPQTIAGGPVWLVDLPTFDAAEPALSRLKFRLSEGLGGRASPATVDGVEAWVNTLAPLPAAIRESPAHVADQDHLRGLAEVAVAQNPVVGSTTMPMPAPNTAAGPAGCCAGQCAVGSFFADAVHHVAGTELALFDGKHTTGPGWPAGKVTLLHLLQNYAYTNTVCTATVYGLTLVELLNASVAHNTFNAAAAYADLSLISVSQLVVDYVETRPAATRLFGVRVRNTSTDTLEHIQPLRLYTVASYGYMCSAYAPFNAYLSGRRKGETGAIDIPDSDLHAAAATFLESTDGGLTPAVDGRMVSHSEGSTAAAGRDMREWVQTPGECSRRSMRFDVELVACVACREGEAFIDGHCTRVVQTTTDNRTLMISIVSSIAALGLLALALATTIIIVILRPRWLLRHCPRDDTLPFTVVFLSTKNEAAMREHLPRRCGEAFAAFERIIDDAAAEHSCHVARRLDAHFMVVAKDPVRAMRCIGAVLRDVEKAPAWTPSADVPVLATSLRGRVTNAGSATGSVRSQSSLHADVSVSLQQRLDVSSVSGSSPNRSIRHEVAVGVWHGTGTIRRETSGAIRYGGQVADSAAAVACLAGRYQVLLPAELAQVLDSSGVNIGGSVDDAGVELEVGGGVSHGAHSKSPRTKRRESRQRVPLFEFSPAGVDRDLSAASVSHNDQAISSIDAADAAAPSALTAALEQADGGLASRRCGIIAVYCPALREPIDGDTAAEHASRVLVCIEDACLAARQSRLLSALDGFLIFGVNVPDVSTAQVGRRATEEGLHIAAAVQLAAEEPAAAGVSVGVAAVGVAPSTAAETSGYVKQVAGRAFVVKGLAVERARFLAVVGSCYATCNPEEENTAENSLATEYEAPVLVGSDLVREAAANHCVQILDLVAWPPTALNGIVSVSLEGIGTSTTAMGTTDVSDSFSSVALQSASPGGIKSDVPANGLSAFMRLHTTLAVRVEGTSVAAAEDEWMYKMADAESKNPFAIGNSTIATAAVAAGLRLPFEPTEKREGGILHPTTNTMLMAMSNGGIRGAATHAISRTLDFLGGPLLEVSSVIK